MKKLGADEIIRAKSKGDSLVQVEEIDNSAKAKWNI